MLAELHSWAANHFRWVQYPKQDYLARGEDSPRPFWKHAMPWPQRVTLTVVCGLGLIFLAAIAAALLFALYFLATS
jgi:hypothetical protein